MKRVTGNLLAILILAAFGACSHKKEKIQPPPLVRKEKGDTSHVQQKAPIVNILDSMEQKRVVLYIKDSAATSAGMSQKLSDIYNKKLPEAMKAAKLRISGPPMAWYKTQKAPFFFEAGIPIEKAPVKLQKGFFIKNTGGDSALVAHFFGPNELSTAAYDALNELLKDRNKMKAAPAYEIYVKNPFEQNRGKTDPYKMETDIVMPYK